jgi:cell division protein FtsB
VLALVLLVLVISYASSLRAWLDQRAEIADIEAQITSAEQRVDDLRQTKQRWHDDAYLRRMVRERFGWVLPGEVGYRVIDENGESVGDTPRLDDPADASAAGDQPDWYDQLWGSVEAAGEPVSHRKGKLPQPKELKGTVIKPEPRRR